MAKVTRIKASDTPREKDATSEVAEGEIVRKKVIAHDKKTDKDKRKAKRAAEKKLTGEPVKSDAVISDEKSSKKTESGLEKASGKADEVEKIRKSGKAGGADEIDKVGKSGKKPFILIRPLVYLGRYIRDSWKELRQVRWPNRKATWKMVLAVLVYTAVFVIIITVLDLAFRGLSGLILGNN